MEFNHNVEKLSRTREEPPALRMEELIVANKNYVDLIGFVAHELKACWPRVMNVYS